MKRTSLLAVLVLALAASVASGNVAGNVAPPFRAARAGLKPGATTATTAKTATTTAALDLQDYTLELDRWSAFAQRLRTHPEEAAALRKQLPDHWSVAVDEQRFQVSTEWLGAALDRLTANPKLAVDTSREMNDRLESMLTDSRSLARTAVPPSGRARAKLDEILKRREFRSVHAQNQAESFWDMLSEWVWKFINKLFQGAQSHPAVTKVLLWAVVIALGLAFLGWLIYTLAHLSLASFLDRPLPAPAEDAALPGSWREWVQRARAAAARSEYREAVRIIYGAAVRRIGEAGTWQIDPARTHREYVRLLPANSLQRPPLVAITTCFERVWYGHAQTSAAEYEAVLAELESLG
jgi:hypothetical protein